MKRDVFADREADENILFTGETPSRGQNYIYRCYIPYTDLGADSFGKFDTARIDRHHIHRLEQLG